MSEEEYGPPTGAPIQFPAQPRAKRKLWPWLLTGALFLGLLMLGGCAFFGYRLLNSSTGVGAIYATALEQEDYQTAYDLLCENSKDEISLENFVDDYIPSQDITSVQPVVDSLTSDGDTDVFIVSLVLADGSREIVEYPMVKEDGDWRICEPPTLP